MSHLKSDVFHTFWVLYEIYKRYKGIRLRYLHVLYSFILFIFPTNMSSNFNTFNVLFSIRMGHLLFLIHSEFCMKFTKGIKVFVLKIYMYLYLYISYRYSYSALECASVLHLNSAQNRNENEVNIVNSNSKELHSDAYGEYGWQFSCRLPIIKRKPLGAVCVGAL